MAWGPRPWGRRAFAQKIASGAAFISGSAFALLVVASSLAALTPLAAAHFYQGPNPPPCPDDGGIHERRRTNGQLHCRSIPTTPCRGATSGLFVSDPLAGPTFVGPVLVSVTADSWDAQLDEPTVQARNTDGLPGLETRPIVQQESTRVEGEQVTRTWRVFASPDVRAYEVDFRVNLRLNGGLVNCSRSSCSRSATEPPEGVRPARAPSFALRTRRAPRAPSRPLPSRPCA